MVRRINVHLLPGQLLRVLDGVQSLVDENLQDVDTDMHVVVGDSVVLVVGMVSRAIYTVALVENCVGKTRLEWTEVATGVVLVVYSFEKSDLENMLDQAVHSL